ncbi:hypothetical protein SUGI_0563070 [Cryptomeria japonica]|nr:hypothetical protein SUGI_0563070 [Cryptomeria japonica]
MEKGFFIAKFENVEDRRTILCDNFFSWEDKFVLMIKLWHVDFNLSLETFNKIPIWMRLPNLPLHFWVDPLFEEVGDKLGDFLMVDNDPNDSYHSIFARILVEIDISKALPTEISLTTSKGCWVQPLDYEGIPFKCRRC